MLGDKIGEETGHVKVQRVLPNPGGIPKMEQRSRPPARFSARRTRRPARIHVHAPARRDGLRRGRRACHGQGRRDGLVGGTGRRHVQEGRRHQLPRLHLLPECLTWAGSLRTPWHPSSSMRSTPRGPRALRSLNGRIKLRSVHGARSRASRRAMRLSDIFGWAACRTGISCRRRGLRRG